MGETWNRTKGQKVKFSALKCKWVSCKKTQFLFLDKNLREQLYFFFKLGLKDALGRELLINSPRFTLHLLCVLYSELYKRGSRARVWLPPPWNHHLLNTRIVLISICYTHRKMVWRNQSPSDVTQPVSLGWLRSKHRRRLLALSRRNKALLFSTPQKLLGINQQRSSESQPAQLSIWQLANIRHIRLHPHNSPNVPIRDVNRPLVYRPAYLHERGDLDPGGVFFPLHFSIKCFISKVQSVTLIKGCRFCRLQHRMIK